MCSPSYVHSVLVACFRPSEPIKCSICFSVCSLSDDQVQNLFFRLLLVSTDPSSILKGRPRGANQLKARGSPGVIQSSVASGGQFWTSSLQSPESEQHSLHRCAHVVRTLFFCSGLWRQLEEHLSSPRQVCRSACHSHHRRCRRPQHIPSSIVVHVLTPVAQLRRCMGPCLEPLAVLEPFLQHQT